MQIATPSSRNDLLGNTIRRLLRRGARGKITRMLAKVRPEDVAVMLHDFTPAELHQIFQLLIGEYPDAAADVLLAMEPQNRHVVFGELEADQVATLLETAAVDDAIFLLESLPSDLKEKVLEKVDLEERFAEVQEHLVYGEDTAGRLMDSELVALPQDTTAAEAIEQMRKIAQDVEMISYLYVTGENERLVGVTPLRRLLLSDADAKLRDIMNTSVLQVHTDTDQEEVAQLAARYDLLAIPVVDDEGRLQGIVTVDDIIDVFKEEATEDFYKMAGTSDEEIVYQDRSFKVAGIRLPWILFNLIGGLGAGFVASRFEEHFKDGVFQLALLIGFIPVIMGTAGNIGSQTSTIAVRGLATGRLSLEPGRVRYFVWQQIKVSLILGSICSILVATAAFFVAKISTIALAIALSLFVAVQVASFSGAMIPVLFHRIGFDPAVASGPLVTTTNDVIGILIYFGTTTLLLQWFVG